MENDVFLNVYDDHNRNHCKSLHSSYFFILKTAEIKIPTPLPSPPSPLSLLRKDTTADSNRIRRTQQPLRISTISAHKMCAKASIGANLSAHRCSMNSHSLIKVEKFSNPYHLVMFERSNFTIKLVLSFGRFG